MADISQIQVGNTLYNVKDINARDAAGTALRGVLTAGETSLVINDTNISEGDVVEVCTSKYGVNPTGVTVANGSVTLTFSSQTTNLNVVVKVYSMSTNS